jgi:hypothetical protein
MTRATVDGLKRLVRPEDVAAMRGKTIAQVLPVSASRREREAEKLEAEEPVAEEAAAAPTAEEAPVEATESEETSE